MHHGWHLVDPLFKPVAGAEVILKQEDMIYGSARTDEWGWVKADLEALHQFHGQARLLAQLAIGLAGHRRRFGEHHVEEGERKLPRGDGAPEIGERDAGLLEGLDHPNPLDVSRPVGAVLPIAGLDDGEFGHAPDSLRVHPRAGGQFGFRESRHPRRCYRPGSNRSAPRRAVPSPSFARPFQRELD